MWRLKNQCSLQNRGLTWAGWPMPIAVHAAQFWTSFQTSKQSSRAAPCKAQGSSQAVRWPGCEWLFESLPVKERMQLYTRWSCAKAFLATADSCSWSSFRESRNTLGLPTPLITGERSLPSRRYLANPEGPSTTDSSFKHCQLFTLTI